MAIGALIFPKESTKAAYLVLSVVELQLRGLAAAVPASEGGHTLHRKEGSTFELVRSGNGVGLHYKLTFEQSSI